MVDKYSKIIEGFKKTIKFSLNCSDPVSKAHEIDPRSRFVERKGNNYIFEHEVFKNFSYGELVSLLLRTKYSLDQEFSILRQRDDKPEEFAEYYDFAEMCKQDAKRLIEERERYFTALEETLDEDA